jgi:hypothetical protein
MNHELILEWVVSRTQFDRLWEFARGCNHELYFDPMLHRLCIVKRKKDGKWVGWAKIPNTPAVQFSWHPEHSTPRDVVEGCKMFGGWAKIQYGEAYVTVPNESTTFTESVMGKLGFYSLKSTLYVSDGVR